MPIRVAIVGDFDPKHPLHPATGEAIAHAGASMSAAVEHTWLATEALARDPGLIRHADAMIVAPGSPYRSLDGALAAIRWARENRLPSLGTCGGFQHMVIEVARNVIGAGGAAHAEYEPDSENLFVSRMVCSLAGKTLKVDLLPGSIAARAYGAATAEESYYCNFGLVPGKQHELEAAGFRTTGTDDSNETRVLELSDHPFFVGTLFVPQARSRPDEPHPLIEALLECASGEVP